MVEKLIVGLGNPGEEYVQTRHNAGFLTVDELASRLGGSYWKNEAGSLTCKVKYDGMELVLAKPQTFMNVSGAAVKRLCETYDIDPEQDLTVIADELDLPFGEVRAKVGGGHAGHNGHRSIIDRLQTRDYQRIRIGIGRPSGKRDPSDYVLEPLRPATYEELLVSVNKAADLVLEILKS